MNIIEKVGLKDVDILDKLKLGQFSSKDKLGDPTAIKEIITYKIPPVILIESDTSLIKLRSSANLSHSLQLFNETSDNDPDSILSNEEKSKAPLKLNTDNPVLKHSFLFGTTNDTTSNFKGLEIGVDVGVTVKTMAYFKHEKNDIVKDAVLKDLKEMSFAFILQHVKKLKTGEALAVVTNGNLLVSLSFDSSNIMSGGLSGVAEFVEKGKDVLLDVDAGVEIGVDFSLNGDYELVFSRISTTHYGIIVRSAVVSEFNAGIQAGVTAAFNNPEAVSGYFNKQLDRLLEAVTNMDASALLELEEKLKNASINNLPFISLGENEQKAVDFLIDRLKLKDEVDKITSLLKKLGEIRSVIKDKITTAAKTKIEAGFNYEYSRITSNSVLLNAEITGAILSKVHKDLVLFNTASLIDLALEQGNQNELLIKEYLKEKIIKKTFTWGISIGLGDYKVGGQDFKEIESKVQKTIINGEEAKKVAFEGVRKYEESGNLGGFGKDYWVAFNAAMGSFKKEPLMSDFDFGFSFFIEHYEGKLRKSEKEKFLQIIDMAQLWNIISESDSQSRANELWALLNHKTNAKDINFSLKLNFSPEAFDSLKVIWNQLFNLNTDSNLTLLSRAFGKAMPYNESSKYRKNIDLRGKAYGELWNYYFKNEGFEGVANNESFAFYSQLAENYFMAEDRDLNLGRLEGNYDTPNDAGDNKWFGGIIRINNPAKKIKSFMNGLEDLLFAIQANDRKYEKVIKRAFNEMQSAWAYQFCIKALGIYFLEIAKLKGVEKTINAQLEIRYTDKEENEKVILLTKRS